MIGAQADEELHRAVAAWRIQEDGKTGTMPSVSDFILKASLEKLEREGIVVDRRVVLTDGRTARLDYHTQPLTPAHANDKVSSAVDQANGAHLKQIAGEAEAGRPAAPEVPPGAVSGPGSGPKSGSYRKPSKRKGGSGHKS